MAETCRCHAGSTGLAQGFWVGLAHVALLRASGSSESGKCSTKITKSVKGDIRWQVTHYIVYMVDVPEEAELADDCNAAWQLSASAPNDMAWCHC